MNCGIFICCVVLDKVIVGLGCILVIIVFVLIVIVVFVVGKRRLCCFVECVILIMIGKCVFFFKIGIVEILSVLCVVFLYVWIFCLYKIMFLFFFVIIYFVVLMNFLIVVDRLCFNNIGLFIVLVVFSKLKFCILWVLIWIILM